MVDKIQNSVRWTALAFAGVCLLTLFVLIKPAGAITPIPTPDPIPGSYGLAATKTQAPPAQGATITTPGNGSSFGESPITVSGICPADLLVQVYNNGVMVGSVMCTNGSFSIQVSLFSGLNELTAIVYDTLDQAGPTSNAVTVNFNDSRLTAFGQLMTLTSSYGRRSAAAGASLAWPVQLTGGTGPYAMSIDWGDATTAELRSESLAGVITLAHTYKKAGIYQVNIRVTDTNGLSAFLQVIAVSNGEVDGSLAAAGTTDKGGAVTKTTILWIPAVVGLALLIPAYWLGRRSQLVSLHNKMLRERDSFKTK